MPILLRLQKLLWKGDGGWTKSVCVILGLIRRSRVCRKNAFLGHPKAQATSYCLFSLRLRASKNAFNVVSVKLANSLSPSSIVKKVRTWSKSSQGTQAMPGKSRELTTPPESPNMYVWSCGLSTILISYALSMERSSPVNRNPPELRYRCQVLDDCKTNQLNDNKNEAVIILSNRIHCPLPFTLEMPMSHLCHLLKTSM